MIVQISVSDLPKATPETEPMVRIAALADAYGDGRPFCRFYRSERGYAALFENTAFVQSCAADEELMLFLQMTPEVQKVHSHADFAEKLAARVGTVAHLFAAMRLEKALAPPAEIGDPKFAEIYPLLKENFEDTPPFDVWYADVHHRYRRGRFHAVAVECEGECLSTAMTVAEGEQAVLLGGVATRMDARRRGYATRCVSQLAAAMRQTGRAVWIVPRHEAAERLYRSIGFETAETVGVTEIK